MAQVSEVASKRETASEKPAAANAAGSSAPGTAVAPAGPTFAAVAKALSEFAVKLVHADGGELYVVSATTDDVHLHLTGTCAGCPGATMTRERLLEPTVHGAAANMARATVKVTTGWRVPEGASKID